jgi:hypothetical protein
MVTEFADTGFKTGNYGPEVFSGYVGSGEVYLDRMRFDPDDISLNGTMFEAYSVQKIFVDSYNFYTEGYPQRWGILGYGPSSPFWM